MREIKFRAKRIDNGEWVYGNVSINPLTKKSYIDSYDNVRSYVYEIVPETVGQFTGLKDKNGVEIYEGDKILKFGACESPVVFENGAFGYIFDKDYNFIALTQNNNLEWENNASNNLEVIGNIHGMCENMNEDEIDKIMNDILKEVKQVSEKFPPYHSVHEGYAIMLEEFDELWDEVKQKDKNHTRMYNEAK